MSSASGSKAALPGPPTSRGRVVLEEDAFTSALEYIIQRDFFPHLPRLKAQRAYLEALQNPMLALARTPQNLPMSWPTPRQTGGETPPTKREAAGQMLAPPPPGSGIHTNMSVDAFLNTYTSEDNASFDDLQERLNALHRKKFPWLYETETRLLAAEEKGQVLSWPHKTRNLLMYPVDGAPMTLSEQIKARDEQPIAKYENTRFAAPAAKEAEPAQPSSVYHMLGQSGVLRNDIPASMTPYGHIRGASPTRDDSLRSYVPGTPTLVPGVDATPMMTWGDIEGTPLALDPSMTPRPNDFIYKLPAETERDKIAQKLSDDATKRLRKRAATPLRSAHGAASPLLARVGGSSPFVRMSPSFRGDSQLRASYSTTPRIVPRSALSTPVKSAGATPSSAPTATPKPGKSLTDDLLQ